MMDEPPVHVTSEEVHAHAHRTGRPALDLVIALSAIFISAVSLVVAIEHGRTERDLVAANSWPFLRALLDGGHNDGQAIAIGFSNGGVGPAKVKSLELFYDGQPVASARDLLRRCCGLAAGMEAVHRQLPGDVHYQLVDDSVWRPGEEAVVIEVRRDKTAGDIPERLSQSLLRIGFRACYCSVFDECWVSTLRSTTPARVRRCEPPQHRFIPGGP
jgi:hypothetical protein